MISEQQLGTFEVIETIKLPSERRVALLDYTTETTSSSSSSMLIDFETAWGYQRQILDEQMERLASIRSNENDRESLSSFLPTIDSDEKSQNIGHRDTVIMLQHHPVYTLGTGSDEKFVRSSPSFNHEIGDSIDPSVPAVPVIRMDRGGEVTYHGPGQITVYPVLDLRSYRQDIHWYMRALEEAIILAISKCGSSTNKRLRAEREDGVTGVWIDNHKVAAVGIKCRRWVTQHGLAVNVEESSLSNFGGIVPCGLEGRKVGCLNQFLVEQGDEPITVRDFAILMKEALEEVFRIELVDQPLLF
jgi:lipoyl(octanoyl) transferase